MDSVKGKVLILTAGRRLVDELAPVLRGRGYECRGVETPAEAESAAGEAAGVVVDLSHAPFSACARLMERRANIPVVALEPLEKLAPGAEAPLRRLHWPFPLKFPEDVKSAARPVVLLADRNLFMAKAVQLSFKDSGCSPIVLESCEGLIEFLQQESDPIGANRPAGLWERLFGSKPQPQIVGLTLGNLIVALYDGGWAEAMQFDEDLRAAVPRAVCYFCTGEDPMRDAVVSLRGGQVPVISRHHARLVPALIDWAASEKNRGFSSRPSVLLIDQDKEILAAVGQALLAAGYRVELAKDSTEALKSATLGTLPVAVIGMNFAYNFDYNKNAAAALGQKLRARDPQLRLIFLVDKYPLERALLEMSEAVGMGADDVILKPPDLSRILKAVDRAFKRRRISVESSRMRVGLGGLDDLDPGTLIGGRYELVSQVGEGGMGVVFQAFDRQLDRRVALKKMRPEIQANAAHREKFVEEARLISRLSHPYIVGVHEIIEEDGDIYLVFDFIDGKPLSAVLAEKKRLNLGEARKVFHDVCDAVDAAHRARVLHRDLKPSNIMVDVKGYVKVMDFGLAREVKESLTHLTQKDAGGTLAYMAPEQHLGHCSRASDVYSLGVCFYETLTGKLPFRGPDFLAQKERMRYEPPRSIVPELPPALDAVLGAALAPDPRHRLQGALDLLESIESL